MAATNEVERIVRKLLTEERDDTRNAIQELSAILTEQVIPKLANRSDGAADWADEREAAEDDDVELPERGIPPAVTEAFSSLYHTLSSEQAAALAELFTTIDSELDDEGRAEDEEQPEEDTRVHA